MIERFSKLQKKKKKKRDENKLPKKKKRRRDYLFLWEDNRSVDSRILVISKFVLCIPLCIQPLVFSCHGILDFFDFFCFDMIVLFILQVETKRNLKLAYTDFSERSKTTINRVSAYTLFPALALHQSPVFFSVSDWFILLLALPVIGQMQPKGLACACFPAF